MEGQDRAQPERRHRLQKLDRFRPCGTELRRKIVSRRTAEPGQSKPDGDLDARGMSDGVENLVDLLEIVGGIARAAICAIGRVNLLTRLYRVVIMESRPRRDRPDVFHLVDRSGVEQRKTAGR